MPPFNWNDLRVFLAVVRTGSPVAAAAQLKVDHTTIRRRVSALEESLSARLFEPRDRGFLLTSTGEALLPMAEAMESLALSAEERIAGNNMALSGSIRVGAPDGFGSMFLAPHLAAFALQHPELQIELDASTRLFNLAKKEADIAISIAQPSKGRQVVRKIADCRLYLYAAAEYLAKSPSIRTTQDLSGHRFLGYCEDMPFAHELAMPTNLTPIPNRFLSTSLMALYHATLAGGGLCFLPAYMTTGAPSLRRVLPSELSVDREIWMTLHADLKDIARFRIVADFIAQTVVKNRHLFSATERPELRLASAN